MTKFKSTKNKAIIAFVLISIVISNLCAVVRANNPSDLPESISQVENGLVKIVVSCIDDSGKKYYVRQGTGFLVGTPSEDSFIFTDYQVVNPSEDDYTQIKKGNGLSNDTKLTTHIQILLPPSITMEASLVASSSESSYALLLPSTRISNKEPLRLSDSSQISRKQNVFIYGYEGELSILGNDTVISVPPTVDACSITSIEREPTHITTDSSITSASSGAPLLDEKGFVLGMMCYNPSESKLDVIPVDVLKNLLETLGILYMDTQDNNYNVADEGIIKELQELILECQKDVTENESNYSKSTLLKYKEAIQAASEVMSKDNATKDDYQNSVNELTTAKKGLKSKNFIYHIVQVILLLCIVLIIALNISQNKKYKRLKESVAPPSVHAKKRRHLGALINIETSEVIWLTKKGLRIGKSPKEVDYCIYDNPAVSRYHAAIIYNSDKFFIIDNHSTNRTCINHSFIEPEKAIELNDEDFISIANVVFQFRLMPN